MRSQLGQQWRGLTAGVIAGLAWTAAKVAVPALVAVAIDRGIGDDSNTALLRWSLAILVAGVVAGVCSGLRRWFAFREARWSEAVLRDRIFAHLQRLHFAFHDEVQTGQLMSRANTDLQQVQAFVVMIPITISNAATVLAAAVIMFSINPLLALLALGPLPFVNVLARRFSNNLFPSVMAIQAESAELATVVEETVSGIRVVKGFGSESVQSAKLRAEADDVYERSIDATKVRARYMPAMDLLPNLGLLAVLGYGGHLVLDGQLTIGELVAFNTYVALLIWPLRMLGQIVAQGQRAAAASGRVAEVLATDPQIVDHPQPRKLPAAGTNGHGRGLGEVRFDGVTFAYSGNGPRILDGLDLVVEPGASVALVGATGCGKTTVARLIPRFYDVTEGSVSHRRCRRARPARARAATGDRHRVRGHVPLQRHRASEHRVRRPRGVGRTRCSAPHGWRARTTSSWRCPRATTRSSASVASRSRVGSVSASRSRVRSSPTRAC